MSEDNPNPNLQNAVELKHELTAEEVIPSIDITIPRSLYWKKSKSNELNCPKCNSKLINLYQQYLLFIKEMGKVENFFTGNKDGFYCPNCPTVVLDLEVFEEIVNSVAKFPNFAQFLVAGLVNLKAIPEDKKSVPLGDDENPIPLVEFTTMVSNAKQTQTKHQKKPKKKLKRSRKK
jgi:hypothetical protein